MELYYRDTSQVPKTIEQLAPLFSLQEIKLIERKMSTLQE